MSILLKLNQQYYSLDTSHSNVGLIKKQKFFEINLDKLKYLLVLFKIVAHAAIIQ